MSGGERQFSFGRFVFGKGEVGRDEAKPALENRPRTWIKGERGRNFSIRRRRYSVGFSANDGKRARDLPP